MSNELALPALFAVGLGWFFATLWRRGLHDERWADPVGDAPRDWVQRVPRIFTQPHLTPDGETPDEGIASNALPTDASTPSGGEDVRPEKRVSDTPAPDQVRDEPLPASPPLAADSPDDLTRIKGIGKVMERHLHGAGVFTFERLAAFNADDIARFSADLKGFGDRVNRDDWVGQARALAARKRDGR